HQRDRGVPQAGGGGGGEATGGGPGTGGAVVGDREQGAHGGERAKLGVAEPGAGRQPVHDVRGGASADAGAGGDHAPRCADVRGTTPGGGTGAGGGGRGRSGSVPGWEAAEPRATGAGAQGGAAGGGRGGVQRADGRGRDSGHRR